MSDPVYQPDHKPLLNSSTATYLGVFGAVAIAVVVILAASALSTPSESLEGVSAEVKQRRITLREQVNGEGHALINAYGKSKTADQYRIPVAEAEKLLVNDTAAALDAARGVSK